MQYIFYLDKLNPSPLGGMYVHATACLDYTLGDVYTCHGAPVLFSGDMYDHTAHTMVLTQLSSDGAQATTNIAQEGGLSYWESIQWQWIKK